jgi:uncharacterized membrane protein
MAKRAISDGHRAWLIGEIQAWRNEGVVAEDQSERILSIYESAEETSRQKHSLATFALMSVAAFLMGLAALLLIGYNWEAMPKPVKLAIIFGVIAGTHGLGFWLRYARRATRLSEVVLFLGCLFYGCGIWLIAQVFNIQGHFPNALWIWALGTIPFALCLDTLLLHALVVALLATWVGTEILNFDFLPGFWRFPNACYTLPLLAFPGLIWAYRKRSPAVVGLYVPLISWWVILQPIVWHANANVIYFLGAAGALFLAIAQSHRAGNPMAAPYRLYGVLLTAGVLSVLSFADVIRELLRDSHNVLNGGSSIVMSNAAAGAFIGLAGIGAIVLADAIGFRRTAGSATGFVSIDLEGMLRRQWLTLLLMVLMAALCFWIGVFGTHSTLPASLGTESDLWSAAVLLPTVVTNAALVLFAIWLIRVGLRDDHGKLFAAGVIVFLLWAVFRYVDLFAGIGGMLGASLMFFLCGAALFGMARFWAHRKEIGHV